MSRLAAIKRKALTDAIVKPPSTNEARHASSGPQWFRSIPYPRATLSSLSFNIAAVVMFLPPGGHTQGTAAPWVLAALLHIMGLLSLANWSLRIEWMRLCDICCMLVLKVFFMALALGLESSDGTIVGVTVLSTLVSLALISDRNFKLKLQQKTKLRNRSNR